MPVPRLVSAEEGHDAPADPVVRTLVMTDLVGSTRMVDRLGDTRAYEIATRHDRVARDLLSRCDGLEIDKTDGFLLLFGRPVDAVAFTLAYHRALSDLSAELGIEMAARAGIHLGEVMLHENPPADVARGAKRLEVEGIAKPTVARLASLARGGQTLLTQGAFDLARRSAVGAELPGQVSWLAHGAFVFKGVEEPLEVFEAGIVGLAPLSVPPDNEKAHRVVAAGDEATLGWRPAPDQRIPLRPNWVLEQRIGTGGFGEVWLASHEKTREKRVFKFCLDANRLRSLKREITLFRLLKEALGHRDDIARVLDCNFDQAPYFLESEYTEGGNLVEWAKEQGGLSQVPVETRLELVAQVAEALAAAHSVGVLHKDVKPANVLVRRDHDGRPKAQLTDFGISRLIDERVLSDHDITLMGMTEVLHSGEKSMSGGTYLYMAPEVIEGKVATVQADLYALGVLLYQMVAGNFAHPLSPGWRRDVPDEILAGDVARLVDGSPERRPASAAEVADGLRRLDERRVELAARRAREKAQRRWKLFASFGAVASLVLVIVSALAIQAVSARREAERRRGQAEGLIGFMLGDLRQKLRKLGRSDILDEVGDKALEYFASVPAADLSDDEIFGRSRALMQIGQLRIAQAKPRDAMAAFQEALALVQQLARKDLSRTDWQQRLGSLHYWIGKVLWDQGDLNGALERFQAQLAIARRLSEADPSSAPALLSLARALNNVGFYLRERGKLESGLAAFREALKLKEALAEDDPESLRRQLSLAIGYDAVGVALFQLGKPDEALESLRKEQSIALEMLANDPDHIDWLQRLAMSHVFMCDPLDALGQEDEALEQLTAASSIFGRLTAIDSSNTTWQHGLAVTRRKLGLFSIRQGDLDSAGEHTRISLDLMKDLTARDLTNTLWQRDLAVAHIAAGGVLLSLDDVDNCQQHVRSALAILEPLIAEKPWDRASHRRLGEGYLLLGRARHAVGDQAGALTAWRRAAEITEEFAQQTRDAEIRETHAEALRLLARERE